MGIDARSMTRILARLLQQLRVRGEILPDVRQREGLVPGTFPSYLTVRFSLIASFIVLFLIFIVVPSAAVRVALYLSLTGHVEDVVAQFSTLVSVSIRVAGVCMQVS